MRHCDECHRNPCECVYGWQQKEKEEEKSMEKQATIQPLVDFREAQAEFGKPKKNCRNPHFGNDYADLDEISDCVIPALNKHSYQVRYTSSYIPADKPAFIVVAARLIHDTGYEIMESTLNPIIKHDPQGYMATITYGQRRSLQNVTGVVAEKDDDGNSAAGKSSQARAQAPATAPAHNPRTGEVPSNGGNGGATAGLTDKQKQLAGEINQMALDLMGGDKKNAEEFLESFTSFTGKDDKVVPGKRSALQLSGKRVEIAHGALKRKYEEAFAAPAKSACADCGKDITGQCGSDGKTLLADSTTKRYGRALCQDCGIVAFSKKKDGHALSPVHPSERESVGAPPVSLVPDAAEAAHHAKQAAEEARKEAKRDGGSVTHGLFDENSPEYAAAMNRSLARGESLGS